MPEAKPLYLAYLLRLWRDDVTAPWRASLELPNNAERIGLAGLEALFVFLSDQTGESSFQRAAEAGAGAYVERQLGAPDSDT